MPSSSLVEVEVEVWVEVGVKVEDGVEVGFEVGAWVKIKFSFHTFSGGWVVGGWRFGE